MTIAEAQTLDLKFTVKQKSECVTSGAVISKKAGVKTAVTIDHDAKTYTKVVAPGW